MRWGLVLAAALVMGVPATAQADPPSLVIEGSRSAYTDVVFHEPLELRDLDVEISGGDRYAGVVIESLDQDGPRVLLAALRLRGMSETAVIPWMNPGPGAYRVRLLTDAPARVTLHLVAPEAAEVIRPRRALATRLQLDRLDVLAGRAAAQLRLPSAVPAGRSALLLGQVTGQRVEQFYVCATTTASCPSSPAAPPSPLPPAELGVHTVRTDDSPVLSWTPKQSTRRSALFGLDGVRAERGALTGAVVTFAP